MATKKKGKRNIKREIQRLSGKRGKYEADNHVSPRGRQTEKNILKIISKISKIDKIYKAKDSRSSVKKVVVVVQLRSTLQLHGMHTPGFLSFTVSPNLLKLMSIESMVPSNPFILCCPLPFLPSVFPSIRVLSNESAPHIRWPVSGLQLQHQSFHVG